MALNIFGKQRDDHGVEAGHHGAAHWEFTKLHYTALCTRGWPLWHQFEAGFDVILKVVLFADGSDIDGALEGLKKETNVFSRNVGALPPGLDQLRCVNM